ncbi:MAG TPA: thioredoxin domain-containing protein, partial [Gemmatimonadaceae bacterium]|nr:thioredoxin domain-containing protein [Gemmatimonadaceae bacterium]
MPNRLAGETSPYLLQHAGNPVEWYPWGPEALGRAKQEDKPILLSIGYSACHWCHVMERESFEDERTARLMNELFVNIKVDREERPDLDAIYMNAVQAMTGHGGWPMTVFLTPDGLPFYGGTYFPPDDRPGLPSFQRVLRSVASAFAERRDDVEHAATAMAEMYEKAQATLHPSSALSPRLLARAYDRIVQGYDARHGGFGGAPKFPQTMVLDFLLRYWRRTGTEPAIEMVRHSFLAMAYGGIYDQLGGGFHRYAVDGAWLVPHFEKMLYDNALLARLGTHLFQATREPEIRRITEETIEWVAREMTSPEGGFYSALDADSEGEEGKFYVWSESELAALLGADTPLVETYWGVTKQGNFEGQNILHVPAAPDVAATRAGVDVETLQRAVARARPTLYAARAKRGWPARDEKVLAAWNGLMLRAVAEAARVFGREEYRDLAIRNGEFLFTKLVQGGRVLRSYRDGSARQTGFLEDYAAVALGALALYELTFDHVWLDRAVGLADAIATWFWNDELGGFFDTPRDHESLVTRPREITDNAVPSGTSLAADLFLRLAELTGDADLRHRAMHVLESVAEPLANYAHAFGYMLGVAEMAVFGAVEVALVGDPGSATFTALDRELAAHYVPALVLAGGPPAASAGVALLRDRGTRNGAATAYVCREYTCQTPVTAPDALGRQLEDAVHALSPGALPT